MYSPCFVLPYQRVSGQWYAPDLVFTHTLTPEPVALRGCSVLGGLNRLCSARTTDRPQFQAMLEYCRKHKGKVTHVVFSDLSRLARNIEDQSATLTSFKRLGTTPVSCDDRIEDSAAGRMAVNLLGIFNQWFSDNLSERTKYRMEVGAKEGRHLHLAPIGYFNGANGSGLQVDRERAALVRQAFEWVTEPMN